MGSRGEQNSSSTYKSPNFDIQKITTIAQKILSHSWEYGTAAEALLELYNPELSVFGPQPFPVLSINANRVAALAYASKHIVIGKNGLSNGSGATGDPASLGTQSKCAKATQAQTNTLVSKPPRYSNGEISQCYDVAELCLTVDQCKDYRAILISPSVRIGLWSTGNGWAAAGMARILATAMKAPLDSQYDSFKAESTSSLIGWIKEILDAAIKITFVYRLLPNYWDAKPGDRHGFGEISRSSLIESVVYRMAIMAPSQIGGSYIQWAENIRVTIGTSSHVTFKGIATPAINPLDWKDTRPYTSGSPEGQSFIVLMYAA
ncbi:hypothetical protein C8J56DRAFT_1008103 [Mycena floridula]|nr:hypothetical protein C8J56DRAFT_1008103 [Mycena floridula]